MEYMHFINGVMSAIAAAFLCLIVLHPKINEGPLIKAGLILMIFSLSATAIITLYGLDSIVALWRAGFVLRLGIFITTLGILFRQFHPAKRHGRRVSDIFGHQ